jgi:glycosyltransferase involved in cell wall biosynthesis
MIVRVLHIVHQFLPDHVGGTEHYARTLALTQQEAGHQVAVFCRRSGTDRHVLRETWDGIDVFRAVSGPFTPVRRFQATFYDRFLAESLAHVVTETQPDLIHVHHLMGLPASILVAASSAAPLVVTLHDYWWICANAQLITDYSGQVCAGPRGWLNCARCGLARAGAGAAWPLAPFLAPLFGLRAAILRHGRSCVAAWIAPTLFVARWYTAHGFPTERMHVVAHGIEPPPAASLAQVPEHPRKRDALRVAYVGGLARQKGVHILVEAFNELPASARLTVAGDETAFPGYCADLRRQATHPGIQFVGRLDRAAVWRALADADVLVVPSLWYETASLAVQEAFAVGTPVIATNHGALAERVRDEVDGLLVPPRNAPALRDAMRRLMDESDLLERLRAGIQPVRTIAEHTQQLEAIYGQVL